MSVAHIIIYMCAVTFLLPGAVFARVKVALPVAAPLTVACVVDAAQASGLPVAALVGILATENGRPGEALQNDNGTFDLGPFQVNTIHVNELIGMGIAPEVVLRDGCVNAYAAAWLLRKHYTQTGDIWRAIGAYHSKTPHLRDAYTARVKKNLVRLRQGGIFALPPLSHNKEGGQ